MINFFKPKEMIKRIYIYFLYSVIFFLSLSSFTFAGTTGKLSGEITDSGTGEPLFGANIVIEGTYLGAASDIDGYYFINNIPPGKYRIIISAVGYQKTIVENVLIKIDLTTELSLKLNSTVIEMQDEIIVTSQRPLVQKDLTSTSVTISSEDISMMPVESVNQIVNLQAGVVGGHFRGGRSNDVAYLIDGVSVTDAFNGGLSLEVENSSIRQMEVISGTFNAEYGRHFRRFSWPTRPPTAAARRRADQQQAPVRRPGPASKCSPSTSKTCRSRIRRRRRR
jgi:hypothetical protein